MNVTGLPRRKPAVVPVRCGFFPIGVGFRLVVAWAFVSQGAPAWAKGEAARVRYTTARRVFLNRGSAHGLSVGSLVKFYRKDRPLGTCKISSVALHSARCEARGLRRGDRFQSTSLGAQAPRTGARAWTHAPSSKGLSPKGLQSLWRALQSAGFEKVLWEKPGEEARLFGLNGNVSLGHYAWVSLANNRTDFHEERLDLRIHALPMGLWDLFMALDMTALRYTVRPEDARFRSGARSQLYAYELALHRRSHQQRLVFSVGRFQPRHAPGLVYLDGLQVGFRAEESALELGFFAGGLPPASSLTPSTRRWTTGAYWRVQKKSDALFFSQDGRVGVTHDRDLGLATDAEARVYASVGSWATGAAGGRFAWGHRNQVARVSRFFASVDIRPARDWSVAFDVRSRRGDPLVLDLLDPVFDADRGSASVEWSGLRRVVFRVSAGLARYRGDRLSRHYLGPSVVLPGLFGPLGSATLGLRRKLWLACWSIRLRAGDASARA